MIERRVFNSIPFSAYSEGNDVVMPGVINLKIINNEEDFMKEAKTKAFAGVTYVGETTIIDISERGYGLEVPAYYTQKAVHTLIDRIIAPQKTPTVIPPLPSHLLAYESVERWFKLGLFPTQRRIGIAWEQRLKAA